MEAAGSRVFSAGCFPVLHRGIAPTTGRFRQPRVSVSASFAVQRSVGSVNGTVEKNTVARSTGNRHGKAVANMYGEGSSTKDYFEQSKEMIRSDDNGPPRWFSPLECSSRLDDCPLLLFLPGIDGVGLGLILHHKRLGEIFDVWCLHIPIMDRTAFTDLVKLVERTVRSENNRAPNRPIYLVGESIGGCLALTVAAHNPDIDLVLILSNPATCLSKSPVQPLIPFLEIMPEQLHLGVPYMLCLMTGIPLRIAISTMGKGLSLQQKVGALSQGVTALSSYLSVLADILPGEILLWKLRMLKSAAAYANSCLHAVKAQTLILSSGRDQLLPSHNEGEILCRTLPRCEQRKFNDCGHALFLEDGVDLVTIIKGASFYRRGRYLDCASDYLPPSHSEVKQIHESFKWIEVATSPVMISTLENGKIVRGLAGIPSEGPVLLVGYHMLLGLELVPIFSSFWSERSIILRGIAHPMLFGKTGNTELTEIIAPFDIIRVMGAVPVSAANFFKLLSSKSHVLLYPGGMREAIHQKGEEYKLFWPEQSEFVRMAARFGATIIPFGAVGEDDIGQMLLDYDDQTKIPYFKAKNEKWAKQVMQLRTDSDGEVANQFPYLPIILPKIPGRFYVFFGKPIETEGRKQELRDRDKAHVLYLEVKSEVERCITYLKEKRRHDPFRSIVPRIIYKAAHGFDSEIPTFKL